MNLAARIMVATLWISAILGLVALGTWQVHRLAWKRDLIAQVNARLAAKPVPAPVRATRDDVYRRVFATGVFENGRDSFVQASTVLGPGWWVITPLRTGDGRTILINRGYVPGRAAPPAPGRPVTVAGLLRLSEPGGGFLHRNDAAADRWYSRDVGAIAARRGLLGTVPYFIDADADAMDTAPGTPVGGLTVVHFANNHLAYAITWYTLALMAAAGFLYWIKLVRKDGAPA